MRKGRREGKSEGGEWREGGVAKEGEGTRARKCSKWLDRAHTHKKKHSAYIQKKVHST